MKTKQYLHTLSQEFAFKDRFGSVDATPLFARVCADYNLGTLRS